MALAARPRSPVVQVTPPGFGVKSGTGLPHSTTLSRLSRVFKPPPGLGVRPPPRRLSSPRNAKDSSLSLKDSGGGCDYIPVQKQTHKTKAFETMNKTSHLLTLGAALLVAPLTATTFAQSPWETMDVFTMGQ